MTVAVAVAATGCGEDESDGAADEQPNRVAASEPPKVFIHKMAKLLETTTRKGDCTPLEDINSRSFTKFPCPAPAEIRKSMARFKLVDVEQYGSAAVVDYRSGAAKDGAAILLYVSPVNNWGVSRFGIFTKPSTRTSDNEQRAAYDKVLDKYFTAVRARDCEDFKSVTFLDPNSKQDICAKIFPATEDLAKRLKANPNPILEYQGGNGTYGFYALETRKPKAERSTISVMKVPGDSSKPYAVLDVAPSLTADQQRKISRQLSEPPGSDPSQVETSESRKAD